MPGGAQTRSGALLAPSPALTMVVMPPRRMTPQRRSGFQKTRCGQMIGNTPWPPPLITVPRDRHVMLCDRVAGERHKIWTGRGDDRDDAGGPFRIDRAVADMDVAEQGDPDRPRIRRPSEKRDAKAVVRWARQARCDATRP
jgi:hypothetical protein